MWTFFLAGSQAASFPLTSHLGSQAAAVFALVCVKSFIFVS